MPTLRDLTGITGFDAHGSHEEPFTLFVMPHAGGSATGYRSLVSTFPGNWRILVAELPGRGATAGQPPCATVEEAVSRLLPVVRGAASGPYAVLGHSMGALVAYELTRSLERVHRPPALLAVSASPAPHLSGRSGRFRDPASDEQLREFLREAGGTPQEAFEEPELMKYLVDILRMDLTMMSRYDRGGEKTIRTPIAAYFGQFDTLAGQNLVQPWRAYSESPVSFTSWPAGHFYLFEQAETFAAQLAHDVGMAAENRSSTGTARG
ncbi:thioesterase II family protein [Streptomyces sp. FL07-04A]|uniref:thioesterase II family protein n=1 Tax=Streptomyces sp. FL07-04A TaxID=3028658 RepID=UPI0029A8C24C|nr:alpha/beta fold hydrolase [Streptomyces sp. FL07-04A]MDX3578128.1 alpha/beta fold hydrolase [Streptomyces sp. FL07-04A]